MKSGKVRPTSVCPRAWDTIVPPPPGTATLGRVDTTADMCAKVYSSPQSPPKGSKEYSVRIQRKLLHLSFIGLQTDCCQMLNGQPFADRSSHVTQKAHRNAPVGFCFAGAYCILAVLPCVLQASRGLQHLLVLKPPFTPPPAAPQAGGSLVPVARARHHSRG